MNKKASIIHWVLFAVIIAIGLFAALFLRPESEIQEQWSLAFLKENFYAAEKELLGIEVQARQTGWGIIEEMAGKGGFTGESPCGSLQRINYWNKLEKWCFPDEKNEAAQLAKEKLNVKMPDKTFSELKFSGNSFSAKGERKEIRAKNMSYFFDTGFMVELGSSLDDYAQLKREAQFLVEKCQGRRNLAFCLREANLPHWQPGTCGGEELSDGRKKAFCVESPGGAKVYNSQGQRIPVKYAFGLDFTSAEPLPLEEIKVEKEGNQYKLSFEQALEAESYALYYTNWPNIVGKEGPAEDVFREMLPVYFQKKVSLLNPSEGNCPPDKQAGITYLCGKEIVYVLPDESLVQENKVFFAVTVVQNGVESKILFWVSGDKAVA